MGRKGAATRARLLDAAKALLWEGGYAAMSPRDVLDRSGAGQGSLYYHFPGKLDLAATALADIKAEETQAVDAIFDADTGPLTRIETYLRRERDALRGCRLARLTYEAAIEAPELRLPVAAFLDRIAGHIRACLILAAERGELDADLDFGAVAAALLAVVEGGFILARAHWQPDRMRQAIEGALNLLAKAKRP